MNKSELQAIATAAQAAKIEKTVADTIEAIKGGVVSSAERGLTSHTWEVRDLNMKVIVYDDVVIAKICAAVTGLYPDCKVSFVKSTSLLSAGWIDYTITVDWS